MPAEGARYLGMSVAGALGPERAGQARPSCTSARRSRPAPSQAHPEPAARVEQAVYRLQFLVRRYCYSVDKPLL